VAGRIGMADSHFSGGLGLDFWKIVQIDGAYAFDTFLSENSWYAGIRFGF
jgi:hypothetical protein